MDGGGGGAQSKEQRTHDSRSTAVGMPDILSMRILDHVLPLRGCEANATRTSCGPFPRLLFMAGVGLNTASAPGMGHCPVS